MQKSSSATVSAFGSPMGGMANINPTSFCISRPWTKRGKFGQPHARGSLKKNIIPNTQNVKIPRSIGKYLLFHYLKNTKHWSVRFLNTTLSIHQLIVIQDLISSNSCVFLPWPLLSYVYDSFSAFSMNLRNRYWPSFRWERVILWRLETHDPKMLTFVLWSEFYLSRDLETQILRAY